MTSNLMKFNIPEWCGSIYFFFKKNIKKFVRPLEPAIIWAAGNWVRPKDGAQRQKKRNPKRRKTGRKPDPCRRPFGTDQYHPISSESGSGGFLLSAFSVLFLLSHSWRRLNSLRLATRFSASSMATNGPSSPLPHFLHLHIFKNWIHFNIKDVAAAEMNHLHIKRLEKCKFHFYFFKKKVIFRTFRFETSSTRKPRANCSTRQRKPFLSPGPVLTT